MATLLGLYASSSAPGSLRIADKIQKDWKLFRIPPPGSIRCFLQEAIGEKLPLLDNDRPAKSHGSSEELLGLWEKVSSELRNRNRFFLDLGPRFQDTIGPLLLNHTTKIIKDHQLYRGRIASELECFTRKDLSALPANLASAGRANPAGLRYLYLAHEKETCIYEVRPPKHALVAVGTFTVVRDLELLSLANPAAPDFFSDSASDALHTHELMTVFGEELQRPVLPKDASLDYVSTQYLCEFAKYQGLDGVQYESSLAPGGNNVVLFDVASAVCEEDILYNRVTNIRLETDDEG